MYPRLLALLLLAGSLAAAATGASAPSEPAIVSAGSHGLSILVPGQPESIAAEAKDAVRAGIEAAESLPEPDPDLVTRNAYAE